MDHRDHFMRKITSFAPQNGSKWSEKVIKNRSKIYAFFVSCLCQLFVTFGLPKWSILGAICVKKRVFFQTYKKSRFLIKIVPFLKVPNLSRYWQAQQMLKVRSFCKIHAFEPTCVPKSSILRDQMSPEVVKNAMQKQHGFLISFLSIFELILGAFLAPKSSQK